MGNCEYMETCPFFLDKFSKSAAEQEEMKEKYCRSNNLNCAIYMVTNSLGQDKIPEDLYPDDKTKAYMHIAENS